MYDSYYRKLNLNVSEKDGGCRPGGGQEEGRGEYPQGLQRETANGHHQGGTKVLRGHVQQQSD